MQRDCVPRPLHLDQGVAQIQIIMIGPWPSLAEKGVANDSEDSTPLAPNLRIFLVLAETRKDLEVPISLGLPPSACASESAAEYYRTQSLPRQVMNPNSSQTLRKDPFYPQAPSRGADANVRTKHSSTDCKDEESTTSVPKMVPVKENLFNVKEEFESGSPGSGNGTPAQPSQPSVLENGRPH